MDIDEVLPQIVQQGSVLVGVLQVTVTEGNLPKTFYIADKLVDEKAPSLRDSAALYDDQPANVLTITCTSIETFELFVKWLSVDHAGNHNDRFQHPLHVPCKPYSWYGLQSLSRSNYLFGHKFLIHALCKEALQQIASFMQTRLHESSSETWHLVCPSNYVYQNTQSGSPLRKILVDSFCAFTAGVEMIPVILLPYPKAFLIDVFIAKRQLHTIAGLMDSETRLIRWKADGEDPVAMRKRKRTD